MRCAAAVKTNLYNFKSYFKISKRVSFKTFFLSHISATNRHKQSFFHVLLGYCFNVV